MYNPLGELLQSIDPESFFTEYNYDMLGRMTQRNHPDAGTTTYVFDGAGNLNSVQTQNLQNVSEQIEYEYDFNRLSRVYYPLNPANDVFYEYGDYNSGNQAGKVTKMEDASGIQEFEYGNMGEIVQNIHTFIVPGGAAYTFETDFEYDSWNRIMQIVYPDGEIVSYDYNNSGQLESVTGIKGPDSYSYIENIRYDLYGNKKDVLYGNNTVATYSYDPLNLRLTEVKTYDANSDMMQDIDYLYDNASNIVEFTNAADAVNGDLGGEYSMRFEYDNIYRLSAGFGDFNSFNNGTLPYQLSMEYSPSGNIVNKTLSATTELVGTLTNLSYDRVYSYNDRPHTVSSAGEYDYLWDANGNQIRSANNNNGQNRVLCWDEENRLMSVRNEGELANNLSVYLYQAGGDRVWKLSGENQQMLINGQNWVNMVNFNKTLYASPYMVMTEKEYTKHYFAGSERICSKLGSGFELSPVQVCDNPLTSISGRTAEEIATSLRELVESSILCTDYNGEWVIDASLQPACNNGNETEKELFFYHSDHLGSSAFITDISGNAIQHLQYLPFGESFIDQRHDVPWHAPYTFSAKEKDEETSYSYFGARYYDSELSVWLSVDPLAVAYPSLSPYNYCGNNAINFIDPFGLAIEHHGDPPKHRNKIANKRKIPRRQEDQKIKIPDSPVRACEYYPGSERAMPDIYSPGDYINEFITNWTTGGDNLTYRATYLSLSSGFVFHPGANNIYDFFINRDYNGDGAFEIAKMNIWSNHGLGSHRMSPQLKVYANDQLSVEVTPLSMSCYKYSAKILVSATESWPTRPKRVGERSKTGGHVVNRIDINQITNGVARRRLRRAGIL